MDLYERDERCDKTSDHIIDIINAFWRRHVPMSPNKFDTVKKRHPLYPAQYEEKQAMLRSATNDEIWALFGEDHPELAEKFHNPNNPNKCPQILITHAPWEMIKAKDRVYE